MSCVDCSTEKTRLLRNDFQTAGKSQRALQFYRNGDSTIFETFYFLHTNNKIKVETEDGGGGRNGLGFLS